MWANPLSSYATDVPYAATLQGFVYDQGSGVMNSHLSLRVSGKLSGASQFSVVTSSYTGLTGGYSGTFVLANTNAQLGWSATGLTTSVFTGISFYNDRTVAINGDLIYANALFPWHQLNEGSNMYTFAYVSASSFTINSDLTTILSMGTKIRFDQTTTKYFYVLSSSYNSGTDTTTITVTGGGTYTVANAAIVSFYYSNMAVADTMPFGSSTFIPLTTPLTSTSYDGGDTVAVGTTNIDTSSVFGAPAGIKAALVQLAGVWSSANNGYYAALRPLGGSVNQMIIRAQVANINSDMTAIVPCDANGDIDIVVAGADVTNTVIRIWGYWI